MRAVVAALLCVWVTLTTGVESARGAQAPKCPAAETLEAAEVSVSLKVQQRRFDQWLATSTTRVDVPRTWPLAEQLLWDDGEQPYLTAMGCLLGSYEADEQHRRPTVVADADSVIVTDVVRMTITDTRSRLAYWDVDLSENPWRFMLKPDVGVDGDPKVLREADWSSVTVVSGIPVEKVESNPPPRRDRSGKLTWSGLDAPGPPFWVVVWLTPPRPITTAAWVDTDWHWLVGTAVYGLADLLVYLPAAICAWLLRRRAGRRSRLRGAAGWLLWTIAAIGAAHLLILVASLSIGMWWPVVGDVGDAGAIWESVGWILFLIAVALFAWWPLLRTRRRQRAGITSALVVGGSAGVAAVSVVRAEADNGELSWQPLAAEPFSVHVLPIAIGILAGLLMIAAYAAVTIRIWRAAGWQPTLRMRVIGLVLAGVTTLLAVLSPVQYAAYYLARNEVVRWLSEGAPLWEEAAHYPRWMLDFASAALWILVTLALLGVLHQRSLARAPIRGVDLWLAAFLFPLLAVYWPDWYGGLHFPTSALLTYGALLTCIWLAQALSVSARMSAHPTRGTGGTRNARDALVSHARSYSELEAEGRRLETRWTGGDAELTPEGYERERSRLRARIAQSRTDVGLGISAKLTPVDIYLAHGPQDSRWGNAITAAERALVPAVLATCYILFDRWRHGVWRATLDGWFGPGDLVLQAVGEFLFWIGIAFVLGYLWRELPGARGYIKPWPLIAAYAIGVAGHSVVLHYLNQSPPQGEVTRILLMVVFLTVIAVFMDLQALDALREAWSARLGPLVAIYRVGAATTTVAFLLAQAAAAFGLWQQLRTGTAVEPPSQSPPGAGPSR